MKTMGDEDYHCVGICIVHERDAPDDRVMLYIVYYVCICITYIYALYNANRLGFDSFSIC